MALRGSEPGKTPTRKLRIGISACLLGQNVRYDGGHKHERYLTETLGRYFDWTPICPEVEFGLGIPRDTIRLEQLHGEIRLVTPKTGRDLTEPMRRFSVQRARALATEDLDGCILKSDSPSCGLMRVRVYGATGRPARMGQGFFAKALAEQFPHLPIEEEGRLCDPHLRENWIERVFAYRRIKSLWRSRWTLQSLVIFHTAHKLTLLVHSPRAYEELGRLVSDARNLGRPELRAKYHALFMSALAVPATTGKHANVLQHMAGYIRKRLDDASRRELADLIDDYRKGELPLVAPLALIKHYVRRFDIAYLAGQIYLNPHPKELALRNHV